MKERVKKEVVCPREFVVHAREKVSDEFIELINKHAYRKDHSDTKPIFERRLRPRKKNTPEREVQNRLFKRIGKNRDRQEVVCEYGRIDILVNYKKEDEAGNEGEIIEIKNYRHWKHAFGQVKIYNKVYKTYKMTIHLFDTDGIDYKTDKVDAMKKSNIEYECRQEGVTVTWE